MTIKMQKKSEEQKKKRPVAKVVKPNADAEQRVIVEQPIDVTDWKSKAVALSLRVAHLERKKLLDRILIEVMNNHIASLESMCKTKSTAYKVIAVMGSLMMFTVGLVCFFIGKGM